MSIENKLQIQGNYSEKSIISSGAFNINVKTSSMIVKNLIDILKNKYDGTTYTISSNSKKEDVKNVLSNSLKNYTLDFFDKDFPFQKQSTSFGYFTSSNATLYLRYYSFLGAKVNPNVDRILCKILPISYNDNLQISKVTDGIYRLTHSMQSLIGAYGKTVGPVASMNAYGYDDSIKVPYYNFDQRGHVSYAIDSYKYTAPSWNDCKKILYDTEKTLTTSWQTFTLKEERNLSEFSLLVINYKWTSSNTTYYSSCTIVTDPLTKSYDTIILPEDGSFNDDDDKIVVQKDLSNVIKIKMTNSSKTYILMSIIGYVLG